MDVNQTLQDKYQHLEVSVLKLSEVKKDNEKDRLDAEFFSKDFINAYQKVQSMEHIYLKECLEILTDYHANGSYEILNENVKMQDEKDYAYMIRSTDLEKMDFENDVKYISEYAYNFLTKTKVFGGEVLINKIGSPGTTYIVPNLNIPISLGMNLFMIRTNEKTLRNTFLYIFLNTKLGKLIISRKINGAVPQTIDKEAIRTLPIPIFPMPFQLEIEKLVKDSHKALESSKALYKEAEALLYEALGLDSKNPLQSILHSNYESLPYRSKQNENFVNTKSNQSPNYTIATIKESFLKTGRLDAEYYQSKYEDIETKIHNFPTIKLKDLVQYPITSGATPKAGGSDYTDSKNGIPFLRAVDLKNARVDIANLLYIKPETHEKSLKRTKLMKGDILFSIAGVIGRCAIFDYAFEANINQALAILRFTESKKIKRLYLIAFFNSQFGQMYLERYSRQGLQTNLNLDEVGNLEIPIIDSTTQESIAKHLQKSFELRAEAKKLLESAKAEVESALNNANNGGGGVKPS